jgi:hypothetical protein
LHLAQLFHTVREKIPKQAFPMDRVFLNLVTNHLFTARNQGGQRPCTEMDMLLARIAVCNAHEELPEPLVSRMYDCPLCSVPKFFLHRAQSFDANLRESEFVPKIIEIAGMIARLRQSPFPEGYHHWLFEKGESTSETERKSRVDDFIFDALEGTTSKRNKCRRDYPIQTKIVRTVDQFLEAIHIDGVSLFHPPVALDRYERIRGFLELLLETWSMSLYADQRNRPQIVNLSRLNERYHAAFAQATTAI